MLDVSLWDFFSFEAGYHSRLPGNHHVAQSGLEFAAIFLLQLPSAGS